MLSVKKILAKLLHITEPTTLYRPLSANRTTPWTYTAPYNGMLYLAVASSTRAYCGITWNGNEIGDFCLPTMSPAGAMTIPVLCKKGDVIGVTNLTANCFLSTRTCFIRMGGVIHNLLNALQSLTLGRGWAVC